MLLLLYVYRTTRHCQIHRPALKIAKGAQWLNGRVLDLRQKGRGFEPHRRHCVVSLSKNINPSLELVQPRKTRPYITERLLMGRKESNQTNKTKYSRILINLFKFYEYSFYPLAAVLGNNIHIYT